MIILGYVMCIKVYCQNCVGIFCDIFNLLVDYGINVNCGEVGGDQGNVIYLFCLNMINFQLQLLWFKLEVVLGVFGVKCVGLMFSECWYLEFNVLFVVLDFLVFLVDMGGQIVVVNCVVVQLFGVCVDEVLGILLLCYVEDFDLFELVCVNKVWINGLWVKVKGDVFFVDIVLL